MFVTDVWDDIRELTSGYFAGDEALRDAEGNRSHKQQAPIQLLLRIILSSTNPGDVVLDPFAGSGTTLTVAEQLGRKSIGIELDSQNVTLIRNRLDMNRETQTVSRASSRITHVRRIWKQFGGEHGRRRLEVVPIVSLRKFTQSRRLP